MAKPSDEKNLGQRIEAYFSACDETAEKVILKSGAVSVRQMPYTLAGLAEHLGVPQQTIREKAGGRTRAGAQYAAAMRRIERFTVERALLGELQYSVAAKLLGDLGCGEKLPPDGDEGRIVIVMEDPEGWSV